MTAIDPSSTREEARLPDEDGIVTTDEELDAFRIVRAILCKAISPERVVHRDTKSYRGILLDDNNRKPICRLWFNTKQKYVGVFDAEKNETRIQIDTVADLYQYGEKMLATVHQYEDSQEEDAEQRQSRRTCFGRLGLQEIRRLAKGGLPRISFYANNLRAYSYERDSARTAPAE